MTTDRTTTDDGRQAAVRRALTPHRRYCDAEVSKMLHAASELFDQRGEHATAARVRARADELERSAGG